MKISQLILEAQRQGNDLIVIKPCCGGTLIESRNSKGVSGLVGGENILSARGASTVQMHDESLMDFMDDISNDDVHGMMMVGWLINITNQGVILFVDHSAGGRKHAYHDQVASLRAKIARVA